MITIEGYESLNQRKVPRRFTAFFSVTLERAAIDKTAVSWQNQLDATTVGQREERKRFYLIAKSNE